MGAILPVGIERAGRPLTVVAMQKRKKANRPGAPRGRFREGGSRKATEITLELRKGKRGPSENIVEEPDPVPPEPTENIVQEPDPVIPDSLIHELRLRAMERRNAGTEPWTLQGIVAEALRGWLSNPKNR